MNRYDAVFNLSNYLLLTVFLLFLFGEGVCIPASKSVSLFYKLPALLVGFMIVQTISKTPNRRGTQNQFEKWSNLVLNSHLDLIGDKNDVQHLSICCMFGTNGAVPTYGTAEICATYIHMYITLLKCYTCIYMHVSMWTWPFKWICESIPEGK